MEDEVAVLVCLPALNECEVTGEGFLEKVALPVVLADLAGLGVGDDGLTLVAVPSGDLTSLEQSACTGGGVEGGNACTTSTELFTKIALRGKVELELTVEVLLLEDGVDTDIGSMHLSDLVVLEEEGQAVLVGPTLIGDEGQVLGAPLSSSLDEVLGNAAQTETASNNSRAIEQVMSSL